MKIVCGIPTINRADLLAQCLEDLATHMPDLEVLVIDNGGQGIEIPRPGVTVEPVRVETPNKNLGVPASWNRIMRWGFDGMGADYCLILNDDIQLGLTLKNLQDTIEKYSWWGVPPLLMVARTCWAVVLIHKDAPRLIGNFDEGFFPGWYEDEDYARRVSLACPNGHHPEQTDHISANHAVALDCANTMEMQPSGQMELMPAGLRVSGWGVVYRSLRELRPKSHWQAATSEQSPEIVTADPLIYYYKKWGGGPRQEEFTVPFERDINMTPELEASIRDHADEEGKHREPPKSKPGYLRGDEEYQPDKKYHLKEYKEAGE